MPCRGICRKLLFQPASHAVVRRLDELPQAHLSIFIADVQPASKAGDEVRLVARLREPQLLSPHGRPYSRWVCDLAALLLPHATTPELRACRSMASRRCARLSSLQYYRVVLVL